ncbi:hypothetical protein Ancab_040533 [Ancistrocladus abbreviatus]
MKKAEIFQLESIVNELLEIMDFYSVTTREEDVINVNCHKHNRCGGAFVKQRIIILGVSVAS